MKILVCVKQCFDPESKIIVVDGAIQEAGLRTTVNPYDVVALTQATKMRNAGLVDEVVAVMVESKEKASTMRHALAVGADRGILAAVEGELDQLAVSQVLADVIKKEKPDLIMMGHLSSDRSSSQIAARLSALLDIPAITMVYDLSLEDASVLGTHDLDDCHAVSRAALPAIISVQVYMVQAHYVSMKSLMQAKKKTIETIDYGTVESLSCVLEYEEPSQKAPGTIVKDDADKAVVKLMSWIKDTVGVELAAV